MAKPDDILPQKEAAVRISRSIDTIRRWRKEDVIQTYREPGSRTAFVSLKEVLQVVGLQSQGHVASPIMRSGPPAREGMLDLMRSHLLAIISVLCVFSNAYAQDSSDQTEEIERFKNDIFIPV